MRSFHRPGRSPVYAETCMAATSHPLATATALKILQDGGNAVDAAIAASATLSVVEPHMTGIGGDCFVILAEPDGGIHGLNGSGRAPMAATPDWFRERGIETMPQTGALSVTVPGAVKAWEVLADRFGTRGFDQLFADAIHYAEKGFAIHPRVGADWMGYVADLAATEGAARHYLVDGKAPPIGARHRSPALARVLRAIARGGAKAFYEGEIAADIAATVQSHGGLLAEADLATVTADWIAPVSVPYAGRDVLELPPNGQGIVALIILGLLDRLKAKKFPAGSAERYHLEIEAARLAYSVRDHLIADPQTMTTTPDDLLSASYLDALAAMVDPHRRSDHLVLPPLPNSDTVYLTIVDRDRQAISFINSLYSGFGSKIVTLNSGIALQNRGACFTLEGGHPNEIGPGKRPMHTIIPAMAMRNGKPSVSFGVMGGAYQPVGHAHVFSNLVDYGMDAQEAIDHPRLFWAPDGVLEAESEIPAEIRDALAERGHTVRAAANALGGAQLIVLDDPSGFLIGGSDPRKDGLVLGW